MICAHGRVFSNNNNNKMSSRFVIEGQRAEDPNDDFDVEKRSNEMSVALDARKGKRVEYYQDGTGNNNNKNSQKQQKS